MFEYLGEVYLPRASTSAPTPAPGEVSRAADELTREGTRVQLLQSVFVPQDETCFYLFRAQSRESVMEVADRCGLRFDRFAEAVSEWMLADQSPPISKDPEENP